MKLSIFLYVYWIILILLFILILYFFLYRINKQSEFFQYGNWWQKNIFSLLLIILGFSLYFIEQITKYEENPIIGFVRFFYKVVIGVFLLVYGLMGRHEESEK